MGHALRGGRGTKVDGPMLPEWRDRWVGPCSHHDGDPGFLLPGMKVGGPGLQLLGTNVGGPWHFIAMVLRIFLEVQLRF